MSLFNGKTLMITGGTGSFGNTVLRRFLQTDIGEIRVFSRDEKKQDDMRHEFQQTMPEVSDKLKFYIGDVRDIQSVKNAMHGVDYIFHAAALKQVPSCEFFPIEAVKTNVLGTDNVLTAAIDEGVKCVICLSTDKAAYPVNAMGTSKAMMEKVVVAKSRTVSPEKTKICCTRYGNVLCSRGSVVPLWIEQIKEGKPITITEPAMTRFVMSLEEAVDLVLFAFENGKAAKVPLESYATKTNRKKLTGAYSDKSPLVGLLYMPEDEEVLFKASSGNMLLVHTGALTLKTTRSTQGVAVLKPKKGHRLFSIERYKEGTFTNPKRYRTSSLPARGALPVNDDSKDEQLSLI